MYYYITFINNINVNSPCVFWTCSLFLSFTDLVKTDEESEMSKLTKQPIFHKHFCILINIVGNLTYGFTSYVLRKMKLVMPSQCRKQYGIRDLHFNHINEFSLLVLISITRKFSV